jgi:hypothetical protein
VIHHEVNCRKKAYGPAKIGDEHAALWAGATPSNNFAPLTARLWLVVLALSCIAHTFVPLPTYSKPRKRL